MKGKSVLAGMTAFCVIVSCITDREIPAVSPTTVNDILAVLQEACSVDFLAEEAGCWRIVFHDPVPAAACGGFPDGVREYRISKGLVASVDDGVRSFRIVMLGGAEFCFRYFSWAEVEYSPTVACLDAGGSPATVRYTVLDSSGPDIAVEAGVDGGFVVTEVSPDEDGMGGTVTFTPVTDSPFVTVCSMSARCGARTVRTDVTLVREMLMFSDGTTSRTYDFPEYARTFGIDLLTADPGVSVSIPEGCGDWVAAGVSTYVIDGRKVTSVCFTVDDNGGATRDAVIGIRGSAGFGVLTVGIRQLGAGAPGSLRRGLEAFYNGLGGDGWYDSAGWCSDLPLASWSGVTPSAQVWSEAFGKRRMVYCGEDSDWSLDICNNNLRRVIPDEFWDICGNFSRISIRDEHLEGSAISDTLWHEGLREVCFSRTFIGGSLSPAVARAADIEVMDFYECRLTGDIPEELSLLRRLRRFNACNCCLSGQIPRGIGNLKDLEELNLCDNTDVGGTLPDSFYDLEGLAEFDISDTRVGGALSPRIGGMKGLRRFVISCCEFEGRIPEELGTIPGIAADCDGNYFTAIPEYVRYSGYGRSWTDMGGIFPAGIPFWQRDREDGRPDDFLVRNPDAGIEISRGRVKVRTPRYHVNYSRMHMLPFEEWAGVRYGLSGWNSVDPDLAKRPRYPYADDLPFPADEYRFDGVRWVHG